MPPSRDDVVQDYDAFMAERRQTAERERAQNRKEARHARGLLRKPALRRWGSACRSMLSMP